MVYHRDGQRLRLEDDFPYCVYLGGPQVRLRALARTLESRGWVRRAYPARGRDLWTGEEIPVLALEVRSYGLLFRLRHWLGALPAGVECYNCDLDVAAYYLYVRRLFPCAWYHAGGPRRAPAAAGAPGRGLCPGVYPAAPDHPDPGPHPGPPHPLGAGNGLVLGWDGETLELDAPDIPGLLRDLARRLTGRPGPGAERLGR